MRLLIGLLFLSGIACALYNGNGNVETLTPSNFDKMVVKSNRIWIVEFFAPWCGHCRSLVPEYQRAANALKGIVRVGAVNADEHKELGRRYNIKGFPTIKIFGRDKVNPEEYRGERKGEHIADAGLEAAMKKVKSVLEGAKLETSLEVVELTDENFEKLVLESKELWLVAFYAPWCGHCRNLKPHWADAASELKHKAKLGSLDATVHKLTSTKYGIQKYPTIKLFVPGAKDAPEDYDGQRTSSDIVNFVLDKQAESAPIPEVSQIINDTSFSQECIAKPLCIVVILSHIFDCQSDCRNNYIAVVTSVAERFKKKMWGWVWSEATAQTDLERILGVGGSGYPVLAVISAKKMKYSIFLGSFSNEGIYEFLRDLSYGKGKVSDLEEIEFNIRTVEPWDGKDCILPKEENIDEYDEHIPEKIEL